MHKLPIVPSYTFFPQNQICYEISRIRPPHPFSCSIAIQSGGIRIDTTPRSKRTPAHTNKQSRHRGFKIGGKSDLFLRSDNLSDRAPALRKSPNQIWCSDSFTWRSIRSCCSRWSQRSDVRSQKTSPDVTNKPFIRYTIKLSKKKRHLVIPGRRSYFHNTPLRHQGIASGRFLTSGTSGS